MIPPHGTGSSYEVAGCTVDVFLFLIAFGDSDSDPDMWQNGTGCERPAAMHAVQISDLCVRVVLFSSPCALETGV